MKQPWAWVGWLATILLILSITRNPLYLVLVILCGIIVGLSLQQAGAEIIRPVSLWKLAGWIILLATVFNALTSHYGETVIFSVPGEVPLLSGKVTLEALVYGAINGLVLSGMLVNFSVLNLALPVRDLISLIPRAFFPVAVITSIAVTYLPTTVRQFQLIREAQAVRGHQMRKIRDWLPLLMPLLIGGLEHAMQLAEAMTARGFARVQTQSSKQQRNPRLIMLIGLVLLSLGWITQLNKPGFASLVVMLIGATSVLGGFYYLGTQAPHTSYHQRRWVWQDWLAIGLSVIVVCICILPIPGIDRQSLNYEPYPILALPPFDPLIGLAMLGLLLPGFLTLYKTSHKTMITNEEKGQINDRSGI